MFQERINETKLQFLSVFFYLNWFYKPLTPVSLSSVLFFFFLTTVFLSFRLEFFLLLSRWQFDFFHTKIQKVKILLQPNSTIVRSECGTTHITKWMSIFSVEIIQLWWASGICFSNNIVLPVVQLWIERPQKYWNVKK